MKKILVVATTLLSIAVSENIPMENYPRSTTDWTRNNQFWNRKTKRALRSDIRSEVDEFSNYNNDRQLSEILDTHLISQTMKLPPMPVIRQPDLVQFEQIDLPPSTKSKLGEPEILITIGMQEKINTRDDSQKECLTCKDYLEQSQELQLQQPFYVEEPKWVKLDTDNIANLPRRGRMKGNDPYILSRGKKLFKFKGIDQLNNIIADYEEFPNYPSKNKILQKTNRVKKSANGINRNNTDSMEETNVFKQKMKNNIQIRKLDVLRTYDDPFILSRGKKVSNNEHSNDRDRHNAKEMDNEWITEKSDIKTKAQLIDRSNLKNLVVKKLNLHNREKRNACKGSACQNKLAHQQNQWLANLVKDIKGLPSYFERRDKHSDLLDLLNTPYIISRGKKASYDVKDDLYSTMELNDDINHIETINGPIIKNLLQMLIDRSKCNNDNCDINGNRLTRRKIWRDRRGPLDEILGKYDPYYITRGK